MEKGRFTKFGLTIHPKGGENINWKELTKEDIANKLEELKFIKHVDLARLLLETKIFRETKKNKETGETVVYYSEPIDFGGQLELGSKNGTPHYQCWLEIKPKNKMSKVLKYFSQALYQEDRSSAVSVKVLTEDITDYVTYCTKETRANLPGGYQHTNIDKTIGMLDKYLEENEDAKKSLKNLMGTKDI